MFMWFFFSSRRRHTRCALVTGVQTCALPISTLPTRERLPIWREVFGQTMVQLDIEPAKDVPFHAEGTLCALPGAAYASVSASPVRVTRTRRLIAADPVEMLYLITADAPLEFKQGGREHVQIGRAHV